MEEVVAQTKTAAPAKWRCYLELTKPRVVAMMLVTSMIGMLLAPQLLSLAIFFWGTVGIGLAAGAAAVINHVVDRKIDAIMGRTQRRPIPTGAVSPTQAIIFALVMGTLAMIILVSCVNTLTALLTFATLMGYAVFYTLFLKRTTPQNIVIGGAAGAAPPLLGWTAVTGHIDPNSLLLVLIIFSWTPPHFWALAIARHEEYRRAKIPMLPVTHGIPFTKLSIVLYTFLLCACSVLPYVTGMSSLVYLIGVTLLNFRFLYWVFRLKKSDSKKPDSVKIAMSTFRFSIIYLLALFALLLADHTIPFYWH